MNVFVIPSWYPSATNPLPGSFFKDQAKAIASLNMDIKIGISTWGQNDERLLLWSRSPARSIMKLLSKPKPSISALSDNLREYFTPAFTWTTKFVNGNFKEMLKANLDNFNKFQSDFGKVDMIHAHVGHPAGFIAQQLSRQNSIPYVITEHMSPFPHRQFLENQGKLSQKLMEAYQQSSKNICVSQSLQQQLNSFKIFNTTVIANLADEDFFTINRQPEKEDKFTFFSLGRMVPQKGMDILLRAFANASLDALLRIGGDGSHAGQYKKLAIELGVDDKVTWLGELDKTKALSEYQQCDAFVLPSRHESMGVVFAEAMACGKPVIASICGGPEEFVNDDCGYLIAPENEQDLALAMQKMMKNHKSFIAEIIRNHFKSYFSKKGISKQIVDVYRVAIATFN